ncbi:unnamed protein product [Musa banksii]
MGFLYQKVQENRLARSGFPSRAWVVVKRAAVKVAALCLRRRRWVMKHAKRATWAGLMARMRRAVGLVRTRHALPAASYDSDSYARNFDDGGWKDEEAEFWRSGSFAYRFGQSSRLGS